MVKAGGLGRVAATAAIAKDLHITAAARLDDHLGADALGAVGIGPLAGAKASFDQEHRALARVRQVFGGAVAPDRYAMPFGALLASPVP